MYRDMVLTRRFDDEATSLQRQGELALFAPARGQEAAQVGSAHALRPQDYVFPSYREHGVLQVRGLDPVDRLRFFRGSDHGGWNPTESNTAVYTIVIGAHTLHATGYAMGVQRDGTPHDKHDGTAVITYFGDGATSQGDVNEAMVYAAVNDAPVVFFLQNNQWAISEPTTRQTKTPLYKRGEAFGLPSLRVDGNDVLAVYAATQEALERARLGEGPSFIEAFTYRMGAHTTSDDPTRYRTSDEEEQWRRRDPIDRLAALLRAEDALDADYEAEIKAAGDELGAALRTGVRALDGGSAVASTFDDVYATPHGTIAAERAWYEAYDAGDPPAPQYAIADSAQGGAR
jgi:pyruvate dehydrogenase E1 component alpha subunit